MNEKCMHINKTLSNINAKLVHINKKILNINKSIEHKWNNEYCNVWHAIKSKYVCMVRNITVHCPFPRPFDRSSGGEGSV